MDKDSQDPPGLQDLREIMVLWGLWDLRDPMGLLGPWGHPGDLGLQGQQGLMVAPARRDLKEGQDCPGLSDNKGLQELQEMPAPWDNPAHLAPSGSREAQDPSAARALRV